MLVVLKTLKTNQRFNHIQSLNLHEDPFSSHRYVYLLLNRGVIYAIRKVIKCKNITSLKLSRS